MVTDPPRDDGHRIAQGSCRRRVVLLDALPRIAELAASIERHGLLQPIVVQPAAAERYVLAKD